MSGNLHRELNRGIDREYSKGMEIDPSLSRAVNKITECLSQTRTGY